MKNILITGSSKRIGAEFVKFFYKNNFNIALHYNKSKKQAIKLSKLLRYKKSRVVIVKGDLSSEKGAKKIFSESKKKLGKITHLINCASVFENDDIKNFNSSKWNMNINVNLKAPYILMSEFSKQKFNSVLLNYYRSGNDSVSWHSDDEEELGEFPIIGSLSFGGLRRFRLRNKQNKKLTNSYDLGNGSLLIMKGATQKLWEHEVPKTKKKVSGRINLTFRYIV